jgi:protein involved in polysaccharide export with SLBB domain
MKVPALLLFLFFWSSVPKTIAQNQPDKPAEKSTTTKKVELRKPFTIRAGDNLVIEILDPESEAPNINSTYCVSAKGDILLPRIDVPVQAEGLTHEQFARIVENTYRNAGIFRDPSFKVSFPRGCGSSAAAFRVVSVGGEVKNPSGNIPLTEGMTLYRAVLAAGGPTEFADLRRVKLIRGNTSTICDLRRHKEKEHNPTLKEGDSIHVPQN